MKLSVWAQALNRRHCIALAAGSALAGIKPSLAQTASAAGAAAPAPAPAPVTAPGTSGPPTASAGPVILVVGDSLSAEYGLPRGSGWVALLEKRLAQQGIAARVVNASISGDTTSGGRARLPALLRQHRPKVVVIELGANDALRGLPLDMTRDNLSAMTEAAQQAGARVLLIGMQLPPNYGRDYGERFARLYAEVARSRRAGLAPFMLKGVADVPDSLKWFQDDRIHPLAAAHPLILDNIWPELKKVLR